MLVWDIKHQFARWVDAHRRRDGVTENLILERLAIRLQQADDPRAVMAPQPSATTSWRIFIALCTEDLKAESDSPVSHHPDHDRMGLRP
jgi:hypothetical protein